MATEVPTVRLYIADKDKARRSALHRVYCGAGAVQPGMAQQPLQVLEFVLGVARNVPTQDAQRFIDAGHATTERPKSAYELVEEQELREGR